VVKVVRTFGGSLTNNGLAVSPDRRYVYLTLIGRRSLLIEQVAVATGRRQAIAEGEQPAVSPDGRLLAYATGRGQAGMVELRTLSTGATTTIDIRSLLGPSTELLDGSLTWLDDGTDLVAIPQRVPIAATATPAPAATRYCTNARTRVKSPAARSAS
jgi:hypothetical protein